jgi:hypothetical protein
MPGRSKDEPDYPDYQLLLVSVSQDKEFIENGLKLNLKKEVCSPSLVGFVFLDL